MVVVLIAYVWLVVTTSEWAQESSVECDYSGSANEC